jgi:hypothetical protein
MACTINFGMPTQCRDGKSGVRIAYWTPKSNVVAVNVDASGAVSTITMAASTYWYTLNLDKENGQFAEATTNNLPEGTAFAAQTFTFNYRKLSVTQRHFVQMAAHANGVCFILRDWNDNYIFMGADNGAFLTGDDTNTGKVFGDNSGSLLTFTANEPYKAYFVNSSVMGTLPISN